MAFCHWYQRYYNLHPAHKVAAYASYGFDANMMDMYPAITCGASQVCFPMRKGDETATLRAAIDDALAELREAGTLSEISVKYFGSDITQAPNA